LALDNEGSTTKGNGVWQWTSQTNNTNQEWQFALNNSAPQSGSIYNLICDDSGMALDNGGSTSSGADIVQNPLVYNDTNQEWKLTSTSNGYYTLVNQTSGMALDNTGSTTKGTDVEQVTATSGDTNQEWEFLDQGSSFYSVVCLSSGFSLDNDASTTAGTDIVQWQGGGANSGNTHQEWQLNQVP
jgi:hypothetical protein